MKISDNITDEELDKEFEHGFRDIRWLGVKSFIETHYPARWKIESYNKMVTEFLGKILLEKFPLVVWSASVEQWHILEIPDLTITKPVFKELDNKFHPLLPQECRVRGISYLAQVFAYLIHKIYDLRSDLELSSLAGINMESVAAAEKYGTLKSAKQYDPIPWTMFPVMVRSVLCHLSTGGPENYARNQESVYDYGGYFIINGMEKVLMTPDRPAYNEPFVYDVKKSGASAKPYRFKVEVWCEHTKKYRSTSTFYMFPVESKNSRDPVLHVSLPFIKVIVPVVLVFRVLMQDYDPEFLRHVFRTVARSKWSQAMDNAVTASLYVHPDIDTKGKALALILSRAKECKDLLTVERNINRELFPHLSEVVKQDSITEAKIEYLCRVGAHLLYKMEHKLFTDRDCYTNKAIKTPVELLTIGTKHKNDQFISSIRSKINAMLDKERPVNILDCIRDDCITKGLQQSISTGNWSFTKNSHDSSGQTGIAQQMERLNYGATQSHQMRLIRPQHRDSKQLRTRLLPVSAHGIMDPWDTPDGPHCGIVRNFSILSTVSQGSSPVLIANFVLAHGYISNTHIDDGKPMQDKVLPFHDIRLDIKQSDMVKNSLRMATVLVNGIIIGHTKKPILLAKAIHRARRRLVIAHDTNVSFDLHKIFDKRKNKQRYFIDEVSIRTCAGRILRPVYTPEGYLAIQKHRNSLERTPSLFPPFVECLRMGLVELLDREEEATWSWLYCPDASDTFPPYL